MQTSIENQKQLQIIMNTVLDGLIIIDSRGKIMSFNHSAEGIFGYKKSEVIGKNVKMLMPDPYKEEHDSYLHNFLSTGEKKVIGIGREVKAQRKDGSVFPMELGINEMSFDGQRMFVGTIRDISERKEAEILIEQSIYDLKRSNQDLDEFAYIASHDLKEPIRGLTNNASFLKEDYEDQLDSYGKERLERMIFLCNRMENLVDSLLYFSRLGRQDLAIQETNLTDLIEDIKLMSSDFLEESNAKINIINQLPALVCDSLRIKEVLRNLIINAIKYNDKDQKIIEIGCHHDGVESVFFVKDNGIGIEEEFYNDIFRIFKRLNQEDDKSRGTGVGLTFVKKIIERHNGRVWLESEPHKGTTFYFTIHSAANEEAA